jgi:hypothetical protein
MTENERRIVASVKKEMDKPRLAESVRIGFSAQAAPAVKKPAYRPDGASVSVLSSPTTINSNLLKSAYALRSWQASIEFAQWPKKDVCRG